ncbi:MAG: DUF4260 domain-containing protein [Chloroflexota bacterium]
MKNLIRLEHAAMFVFSILAAGTLGVPGWWYPVFILAPDLSMLGYLANPKVGAFTYNLVHHKATAIMIYLIGVSTVSVPLQFTGILLFGHSSMDRIFGYGLKFSDAFEHTHLGMIGKNKQQ